MPNGFATAKALDYNLKRWVALTRYMDDGAGVHVIPEYLPDAKYCGWPDLL